ncbi:hypothetical protein ABG067_006752 [Albugo candida]
MALTNIASVSEETKNRIVKEEEDFETCRAASGALAMVSQAPKVSQLIVKLGGISMLSKLVKGSKYEETVHRAIFALENVFTTLAQQVCPIPSLSDDVSDQVIQQVRDDMEKHGEELIEELGRLIKSKSGGVPSLKEQART